MTKMTMKIMVITYFNTVNDGGNIYDFDAEAA
jgi:hypothetical protein